MTWGARIDKNSQVFGQACRARGMTGPNLDLVAAVVTCESTWNTFACRFEPEKHAKLTKPAKTPAEETARLAKLSEVASMAKAQNFSADTEAALYCSSFGLMQIMGETARDIGFVGHLTELFVPEVGLEWGIRYLQNLLAKYHDRDAAVSAYNWGHVARKNGRFLNQDSYVNKVRAVLGEDPL